MKSPEIIKETLPVLSRNWDLDSSGQPTSVNEEFILSMLQNRIKKMLDDEMERLVNAMYRLDIREDLFHSAMNEPGMDERAKELAMLVLEREYQKAESRLKYRNK